MLQEVNMGRRSGFQCANIEHYRWLVGDELIDEIQELARSLQGGGSVRSILQHMEEA